MKWLRKLKKKKNIDDHPIAELHNQEVYFESNNWKPLIIKKETFEKKQPELQQQTRNIPEILQATSSLTQLQMKTPGKNVHYESNKSEQTTPSVLSSINSDSLINITNPSIKLHWLQHEIKQHFLRDYNQKIPLGLFSTYIRLFIINLRELYKTAEYQDEIDSRVNNIISTINEYSIQFIEKLSDTNKYVSSMDKNVSKKNEELEYLSNIIDNDINVNFMKIEGYLSQLQDIIDNMDKNKSDDKKDQMNEQLVIKKIRSLIGKSNRNIGITELQSQENKLKLIQFIMKDISNITRKADT